MHEKILRDLGFSERETKVYLALLELGQTTVGPIAAKSRLQHSKVYQTIEKLIDKGLVSYVIISKTKHFQSQDPKNILNMLKEKERSFEEILPELKLKQEFAQEKQVATVYEGYKAQKALFESIFDNLKKGDFYYAFAYKDEYHTSIAAKKFLRDFHIKFSTKDVDDKVIAHNSVKRDLKKSYEGIKNMRSKFTDLNFPTGLIITKDRVINSMWGDRPTAIEIKSKQMAEQYKKFFLEMWKSARN